MERVGWLDFARDTTFASSNLSHLFKNKFGPLTPLLNEYCRSVKKLIRNKNEVKRRKEDNQLCARWGGKWEKSEDYRLVKPFKKEAYNNLAPTKFI
jgi:hypothetical protein